MTGVSTRFNFKALSMVFNYDTVEVAADPVYLMYLLEQMIKREQFPAEIEITYLGFMKSDLALRYQEFIRNEIQKAYLESYSEYGQNVFDHCIAYADAWIEEPDLKDPDTGQLNDRNILNAELAKIKSPLGIPTPKIFATKWLSLRSNTGPILARTRCGRLMKSFGM